MKKHAPARRAAENELEIPELGPEFFKNGVMGKYYAQMMAQCNVVRIAPDLADAFPNEPAVNEALRELLRIRETLMRITADKAKRKKSA